MESAFPVEFGSYVLTERIGAGGMAEIFLATEPSRGLGRRLVIKRILPQLSGDEQFVRMFVEEARLCQNLRHRNIVEVYHLGEVEDQYFIAMEYVHGRDLLKTLAACAKKRMPFPTDLALYIVMQVLKGLDYAHNFQGEDGKLLGIIHRDVSPSNVMLSYDGEVKIGDFGIAKASTREKTATGILKGKFGYMAPEQVMGRPIDHRADVFAVGILLYELLTGHRLFAGRSDLIVLERVRDAVIDPPPRHYRPDLAFELERTVLRALSRDAADRFQTTLALHAALDDYTFRSGVDVGPKEGPKKLARFMHELFLSDETENHDAPGLSRLIAAAAQAAQGKGRRPTTSGRRSPIDAKLPVREDSIPTGEEQVEGAQVDFGDESTDGSDAELEPAPLPRPEVSSRRPIPARIAARPAGSIEERETDEADHEDAWADRPDHDDDDTDHPTGLIEAVSLAAKLRPWDQTTGALDPAERARAEGDRKARAPNRDVSATDGTGSVTPYGGVPVVSASTGFGPAATMETSEPEDGETVDGATLDGGVDVEMPGPIERNDGEGESTELLDGEEDSSLWELHASDLIELSSNTVPPLETPGPTAELSMPARRSASTPDRDAKTATSSPPTRNDASFGGDEVTVGRDEEEVEREVQEELRRLQDSARRRGPSLRQAGSVADESTKKGDDAAKATRPLRRSLDEPTESLKTDEARSGEVKAIQSRPRGAESQVSRKPSRLEAVRRSGPDLPALREVETYHPDLETSTAKPAARSPRANSAPKTETAPPPRSKRGDSERKEGDQRNLAPDEETPAELEFAPTNFGELLKSGGDPTVRAPSSGVLAALSESAEIEAEVERLRNKSVSPEHTVGGDLAGLLGKMGDLDGLERSVPRAPVVEKESSTQSSAPKINRATAHLDPPTDSISFGAEESETANIEGEDAQLSRRQAPSEVGRLGEDGASGLFGMLSILDRNASSSAEPGFDNDEGSLAETGELHDAVIGPQVTGRSQEIQAPGRRVSSRAQGPDGRPLAGSRAPVIAPSVSSRSQELQSVEEFPHVDASSPAAQLDTTGAEPWEFDPQSEPAEFEHESTESLSEDAEVPREAARARPVSLLEAVGRPRSVSASVSGDGINLDEEALEDLRELRHGERIPGLLSDSFALEPGGARSREESELEPQEDLDDDDRRSPSRMNSSAERRIRAVVERQRAVKEFNRTKEVVLPSPAQPERAESSAPQQVPTATGFADLSPERPDVQTADLTPNAPVSPPIQSIRPRSTIEGRGVMINRIAAGLAIVAIVLFSFAGATWVRKLRAAKSAVPAVDAGVTRPSKSDKPALTSGGVAISDSSDAAVDGGQRDAELSGMDAGPPLGADAMTAPPSLADAGHAAPDAAAPRPPMKPEPPEKKAPPKKAEPKKAAPKPGNAKVVLRCNSEMDARIDGVGAWASVTQQTLSLEARPRGYQVTLTPKGGKPLKKNIRPIAGKTLTVGCE
ncbi:MAG: protein kinase [Deltaproteobacteria bacterium]|nr:protein kinase [Deltaproteobacteria bacterium]